MWSVLIMDKIKFTNNDKRVIEIQCKNCKYWTDEGCVWDQPEGRSYLYPVSDCGEFKTK
jgi:hypothetical protein